MKHLEPLTIETAPNDSKESLRQVQKGFGFIPNLMATFAHAPSVLQGYLAMDNAWSHSSLSPQERQLILLTASSENNCNYCQAAHSTVLKHMMKMDPEMVAQIRQKKPIADPKLNALVQLTREIVGERGYVSESTRTAFIQHGYSEAQMLEVMVGIALKTVSNYIDHLNPVAIDAAFQAEAQ